MLQNFMWQDTLRALRVNSTLRSNHTAWEFLPSVASFWAVKFTWWNWTSLLRYWLTLRDAVGSKLDSGIIHCCDGAQAVIFWIQKHFHYEDPREKFFSDQQNENLKQLARLYLRTMWVFSLSAFPYLTWLAKNVQPTLWPISSVTLKPFATLLRRG